MIQYRKILIIQIIKYKKYKKFNAKKNLGKGHNRKFIYLYTQIHTHKKDNKHIKIYFIH